MPRKSKYSLDMNIKESHEGYHLIEKCAQPVGRKSAQAQEASIRAAGSTATRPTLSVSAQNALTAKRKAKAMSMAMKPGQQILMNAFMMYMSGKQLNIFSISMTSMAILNPLGSIWGMNTMFGALETVDLQMPKLIFVALNLAWLGLGLWKLASMRLLPTTSADWTSKILWKEMMEISSIPPDNMIL